MRRKEVNRCRREWLGVALQSNKDVAAWARQFGDALLEEVQRLRSELKLSNRKRRGVHGRLAREQDALELEQDDLDAVIDKLETLRGQVSANPTENVSVWWLGKQLDEIMSPLMEDHHGSEDD